MKALILMLICIIVAFSQLGQATPIVVTRLQMKMNESYTLNQIHKQNQTQLPRNSCSYRVAIDTSCTSPYLNKDRIDIKFGDDYGNVVYASQLDKVVGATFQPCSINIFKLNKPCINRICKLFLFRKGHSGWIPSKVTVSDKKYPAITFDYKNFLIPDDNTGCGFDFCKLT